MWFKTYRSKNLKNIIYVSIDGASIGVALQNGATCQYSDRRIHVEGETIRPITVLLRDMLYALKHQNQKPIDSIIVILESPWVKEMSVSTKEKRLRPFQITTALLENLIKKDQNVPQDANFKTLLSHVIENIKLNGYSYNDPIGKVTDEVEVIFTKFFGDNDIINIIDDTIKIFWNKSSIRYISGAESVFKLGKQLGAKNDMYLSLGSTDTVIRLYSQGMIVEKITIPFGFQNILKSLGTAWGTSSKETIHWVNLFLSKSLSPEENNRIQNDIRNSSKEFIDGFMLASKKASNLSLERPISIIGGDDTWNKLVAYMLQEKYFGEIFPHIESISIQDLCQKIPNQDGDKLIALCACTIEDNK